MVDLAHVFGTPWLVAVLLLATRLAAMLLMTPPLHAVPVPPLVRVLLLLGVAAAMAGPLAAGAARWPGTAGDLVQAFATEAALGAALGLGVLMAFAGFALAGRLLDVQIGFGAAQVFDPLTRSQVPILTSVFSLLALLLFFQADGHHALLRGVALSVQLFPLGRAWPAEAGWPAALAQASGSFVLGFGLVAPVVACVFAVDFVLGVIARNLPQVNMLVLGVPVKIVAGLLVLSVWVPALGSAAARLHAGVFRTWTVFFSAVQAGAAR
jgi:flagellar biosynthetic protein FliR